jgi:Brp/Blh family beta-carotene 15,15'-monooxygenase
LILPLTDYRTLSALNKINPHLDLWAGSHHEVLREAFFIVAGIALVIFLIVKKFDLALDLALITAISFLAPPLIAFSAYFGLWHAVRHTIRLVPKLPQAMKAVEAGMWKRGIWRAILPGLYAIFGTLLVALLLRVLPGDRFSTGLLWPVLVIVWALTVPHMLVTARFDISDLKTSKLRSKIS